MSEFKPSYFAGALIIESSSIDSAIVDQQVKIMRTAGIDPIIIVGECQGASIPMLVSRFPSNGLEGSLVTALQWAKGTPLISLKAGGDVNAEDLTRLIEESDNRLPVALREQDISDFFISWPPDFGVRLVKLLKSSKDFIGCIDIKSVGSS